MANFITTAISGYAKEGFEAYIRPLFVGANPLETPGVYPEMGIRGTKKLNFFTNPGKMLKAWVKGFVGTSLSALTQRELKTYQMKAEGAQDANEFFDTVYGYAQNKNVDWDNITGTVLEEIIAEIWMSGVASDIFRQYWLNDTNKETISSGKYTGTADTNYNAFDGIWKLLITNATTTPTTEDHIFRVAFSNGSAAQVETLTLTGTSGTATVTLGGKTYLATFTTDLATSAANFVTSHSAALLLRGITVTSSTDTVIFTATIAGMPFSAPTIAGVSGNLGGSVAHTTANTAPVDLTSDEALAALKALYVGADARLKNLPALQKVYLVSDSVYENYLDSLEGKSSTAYTFTTEEGRMLMINGANVLKYRGIPVVKMGWDVHLDADFPTAYPHRIIYTEITNLRLGFDDANDMNSFEAWYNRDEQENRFRTQFYMGCQYVHGAYTAVAY